METESNKSCINEHGTTSTFKNNEDDYLRERPIKNKNKNTHQGFKK
jgi:hypothetical protein